MLASQRPIYEIVTNDCSTLTKMKSMYLFKGIAVKKTS